MELTKKVPTTDKNQENNHLLRMLDRGIDDMEAGRELPLEDAFRKITELRVSASKHGVVQHDSFSVMISTSLFETLFSSLF